MTPDKAFGFNEPSLDYQQIDINLSKGISPMKGINETINNKNHSYMNSIINTPQRVNVSKLNDSSNIYMSQVQVNPGLMSQKNLLNRNNILQSAANNMLGQR